MKHLRCRLFQRETRKSPAVPNSIYYLISLALAGWTAWSLQKPVGAVSPFTLVFQVEETKAANCGTAEQNQNGASSPLLFTLFSGWTIETINSNQDFMSEILFLPHNDLSSLELYLTDYSPPTPFHLLK